LSFRHKYSYPPLTNENPVSHYYLVTYLTKTVFEGGLTAEEALTFRERICQKQKRALIAALFFEGDREKIVQDLTIVLRLIARCSRDACASALSVLCTLWIAVLRILGLVVMILIVVTAVVMTLVSRIAL
jgi:hypothetical protein